MTFYYTTSLRRVVQFLPSDFTLLTEPESFIKRPGHEEVACFLFPSENFALSSFRDKTTFSQFQNAFFICEPFNIHNKHINIYVYYSNTMRIPFIIEATTDEGKKNPE